MGTNFKNFSPGINLIATQGSNPVSGAGDLAVSSSDGKLYYYNGSVGTSSAAVTETHIATLTNKTLTSPSINNATIANATLTTPTITSAAISGGTIASAAITSTTLRDSDVSFIDESDSSKAFKVQCSGITTGNTRTWSVPDFGDTFTGNTGTQTLTNKTLTSPTVNSPAIAGGTIASATITASTLRDSDVSFVDESDSTKAFKVQCSGITSSTTRTWTVPDSNDTFVGLAATQTLTGKTLTTPTINSPAISGGTLASSTITASTLRDSDVGFVDEGDSSKVFKVQCSGITTANTRTWTVPDFGDTFTGTTGTQTLTNKTLTTPTIASVRNTGGVKIQGTNTNDNADAGDVGEYQSNAVSSPTSWAATSTYFDLTSVSLTAGDWDVTGVLNLVANSATGVTKTLLGISTTTGNSSTGLIAGDTLVSTPFFATSVADYTIDLPAVRLSLSATTTVYLKGLMAYSGGTPQYQCRISARRVR